MTPFISIRIRERGEETRVRLNTFRIRGPFIFPSVKGTERQKVVKLGKKHERRENENKSPFKKGLKKQATNWISDKT